MYPQLKILSGQIRSIFLIFWAVFFYYFETLLEKVSGSGKVMLIRPDPESVTPKSNYVHAYGLPVKLADLTEYFFPVAQSVISPIG